ncbi:MULTISPECIES: transcription antitermination factor NusB [Campylobacter]|uniref:Transcription antitermination protein NusB n=1 Tax=Campylobacter hominis (strain ATCC BAA-381 / DSM 21671 / CCUG 45161 / LMG 19568 / NCTC 13146 / CH001A) TaxID=360107 RepID=NUSB_CAMHC|nr:MULTISPECIES: transcription antitermination factor NusB [Campylobacter]A7HZG1.1 RecName: Full=Transcription antitermination protein NusB; AltName: Full=Antitermination factor NusB [Campylobacter hominis ATCC BAA-381]ABS52198.1 transcription antitermination factor NusB [Campylobacter hominis ATCC BAA-381]MCI6641177.1 transcription antitermination factor NusB [Campylobacter sp.]MDD7421939.1 transcription antitermination factor NusB [Campylobacter hominis]MDY3117494.1 transcription antitermina
MATRHQVRNAVVSLLYAKEMGSEMNDFVSEYLEEKRIRNDQRKFADKLFNGVCKNVNQIDNELDKYLNEYKISQIGTVERAILRLGAYEIMYEAIDKAIIINEAIELAKELAGESSPKFINGVLDRIGKVK